MIRPSNPILSQHSIRDTALVLIDEEGLGSFSMRRLARRLGVQAASIYGHFQNRDAVLDAVTNLLTARVDTSDFANDWREGLRTWGRSYRDTLQDHPNAAALVAAGTKKRDGFLAMANAVHGGLLLHGWRPRYATMIAASVKYLVIGAATTPFGSGFADDTAVYLDRYPHLVSAHLLPQQAEKIDSDSFELALSSLIAGLELVQGIGMMSGRQPDPG